MYFYVFYCLFYVKDISRDVFEEQVSEERYLDVNEEEDIITDEIRDKNSGDVA